ncbi:sulfatase-like hydrolase/transferase [bacterium]|nr:sulfatase-like hydrolase/transferase [bacterium]
MKRIAPLLLFALLAFSVASFAADRPNILWITSEDNGQELGCYGDSYATSPNIDKLAARGMRYLNAWSTAPVCAPARTTIISGVYPPATGAEHMRSEVRLPDFMKMFPQYLREAGYYCSNNSKEDYNLVKPGEVWDDSSRKAHWRNRKPGQPFFAVFNYTISHESHIRDEIKDEDRIHDPAKVRVPAYHPDTPEVRKDWAQYYDRVTMMDKQVGEILAQLEEDGLADDTIIFYYGDHGSGMPRSKRWPYNSGLLVPMIVYFPIHWSNLAPADYKIDGTSKRPVGFIDLAPTVLSIAGIKPPQWMQGSAFAGRYPGKARRFNFGFRGRMDERYDMVRSVRNDRYIYIRNYMPHKIYGQYIDYMFKTPTTRVWRDLFEAGKLNEVQSRFWETKPPEELYDLEADPDEVHNLADSPEHRRVLKRLRKAQRDLAVQSRDIGFLPENEIHTRASGIAPYAMGHDRNLYPMKEIMAAAELASGLDPDATSKLKGLLTADDSAVRYWAALGFVMRGREAVAGAHDELMKLLNDPADAPRIAAAEALGRYGSDTDAAVALRVLMELAPMDKTNLYVSMMALNAIDAMGDRAKPVVDEAAKLPTTLPGMPRKLAEYVPQLIKHITGVTH